MERPGVRPQCDQRLLLDQRREVQRYRAASGRPARDLRYPDRLQILIGGEGGAAGRSPFSPPFCDRPPAGIRNGAAGPPLPSPAPACPPPPPPPPVPPLPGPRPPHRTTPRSRNSVAHHVLPRAPPPPQNKHN